MTRTHGRWSMKIPLYPDIAVKHYHGKRQNPADHFKTAQVDFLTFLNLFSEETGNPFLLNNELIGSMMQYHVIFC